MRSPFSFLLFLLICVFLTPSHADSEYSCEKCLNGGKCFVVDESDLSPKCICPSSNSSTFYTGKRCQTIAVNCVAEKKFTCFNGGECSNNKCSCPSTWQGDYCDVSTDGSKNASSRSSHPKEDEKPKWYFVLIGVLATVILGSIFIIVVVSIFRRPKNKTPNFVDLERSTQQMG